MRDLALRVRIAMAIAAGGTLAALGLPACGSDSENEGTTASPDGGDAGRSDSADGSSTPDSAAAADTGASDSAIDPDVLPTPRRPFLIGSELRKKLFAGRPAVGRKRGSSGRRGRGRIAHPTADGY